LRLTRQDATDAVLRNAILNGQPIGVGARVTNGAAGIADAVQAGHGTDAPVLCRRLDYNPAPKAPADQADPFPVQLGLLLQERDRIPYIFDLLPGLNATAFTVAGPESPVIEREAGVARVGERSPELRGDQFLQPLEAGA
jgi:hypothetical protein